MIFLPDVNVWLALAFQKHEHHSPATHWFDTVPEAACSFCRLTQQGFLRLATNPKAFGRETATLSPKVWNDAYLAAFSIAAGFEMVTFDKGFAAYKSVHCTMLS